MFKPLINFYQINSVCFLLKFLYLFDQLCESESIESQKPAEQLGNEELVEKLGEMLAKLAKDYLTFKIERKLNKAEESRYSEFVRKATASSKEAIQESDLRAKLDRFDELVKGGRFSEDFIGDDKKNAPKNCTNLFVHDKSSNLDFDTESFLIIYNKIIAELLRLQVDLEPALFSRTLPCFLLFDYYLLAYKNDDFTQKLNELLNKLEHSGKAANGTIHDG